LSAIGEREIQSEKKVPMREEERVSDRNRTKKKGGEKMDWIGCLLLRPKELIISPIYVFCKNTNKALLLAPPFELILMRIPF
jgi:hypothetical protein